MEGSSSAGTSIIEKKKPEDFRFGKLIGEGSFSSVYLAKEVKSGDEFAIKVCNKQHIIRENKIELIKREKEVMAILSGNRSINLPFFVRLYATFQDTERLYFVMTYGRGGDLLKYLHKVGSFDVSCSQFYGAELVLALAHLHRLSIVHRDLKPENILLDERGHILLTDFGSAKILKKQTETINESSTIPEKEKEDDEKEDEDSRGGRKMLVRNHSFVGTAQYVSPEVLQGKYGVVGPPADLWALGCILYQFIAGLPPFHGPNEYLIFQKILKMNYSFPSGFDEDAKDLVESLLKVEMNERLGADDSELYTSLMSHKFFHDTQWDKIHTLTPPLILPFLPSTTTSDPPLRSQIPNSLKPGFDVRVMAERALLDDEDEFWSSSSPHLKETQIKLPTDVDSDEDEEDEISLTTSLKTSSKISGGGEKEAELEPEEISKNRRDKKSSLRSSSGVETNNKPKNMSTVKTRISFPENEGERRERVEEQAKSNPWHPVVQGNLILKQGLVSKRKGLFSRRRMLLLTEGPHLYYCVPNTMVVKGEIPWSASLNPEPKDFRIFFVHTPNRTYYLEDHEGYALEWCRAINEVRQHVYGVSK